MNENEKLQNFADMVNATDKLSRPWRMALILTNLMWAIVLFAFICFAYLTPDTSYQMQDLETNSQVQATGTDTADVTSWLK